MSARMLLVAGMSGLLWNMSLSHPPVEATDWILGTSYYSHDPASGERVTQYAPIGPVYVHVRPDYLTSGYRHRQSVVQVGGSADYLHIVEEWGRPVRPYGEWQFPYRPYSVPYAYWGPPFGGLTPFFGPGSHPALGGFGHAETSDLYGYGLDEYSRHRLPDRKFFWPPLKKHAAGPHHHGHADHDEDADDHKVPHGHTDHGHGDHGHMDYGRADYGHTDYGHGSSGHHGYGGGLRDVLIYGYGPSPYLSPPPLTGPYDSGPPPDLHPYWPLAPADGSGGSTF